jgi:hypothetical protein
MARVGCVARALEHRLHRAGGRLEPEALHRTVQARNRCVAEGLRPHAAIWTRRPCDSCRPSPAISHTSRWRAGITISRTSIVTCASSRARRLGNCCKACSPTAGASLSRSIPSTCVPTPSRLWCLPGGQRVPTSGRSASRPMLRTLIERISGGTRPGGRPTAVAMESNGFAVGKRSRRRFLASCRSGFYLSVVSEGVLKAGNGVEHGCGSARGPSISDLTRRIAEAKT